MNIPTPHISAKRGDFAKTVIMPGDPYRAKYIVENFLNDVTIVSNVRGIIGYTGYYQGKKLSVMASGMGCPSMGIYSYELYNGYDVDNIIRVGSCGALNRELNIMDIVVAQGACYEPGYVNQYQLGGVYAPICDYYLLDTCAKTAKENNVKLYVGNVFTSDSFYGERQEINKKWINMNVLATEMETAGLYMTAANSRKRALSILTVSDYVFEDDGGLTSDEREKSLNQMIKLALDTAIKL